MPQTIAAIYAVSENGVIGKDNDLPWHLPNDFSFFKQKTLGHPVIMGRKSYESLGKALPRRKNVVVTRNPDFSAPDAEVAHSLEDAIERCGAASPIFIIGGAGIYRESIEKGYVNLIYETLVHADVDGDVTFSLPNPEAWKVVEVDAHQADDRHEYAYTFRTLLPVTASS